MRRALPEQLPLVDVKGLLLVAALLIMAMALRDAYIFYQRPFVVENQAKPALLGDVEDVRLHLVGRRADINSASLEELVIVPGIGEKSAEKILEFRQNVGFILDMHELLFPCGPLGTHALFNLMQYFRAGSVDI